MNIEELTACLNSILTRTGSLGKIVSISHLTELQKDLVRYQNTGILDEDFYLKELTDFDWDSPLELSKAKSIIIIAAAQKRVLVSLELNGDKYYLTVPPTYSYKTDKIIQSVLGNFLNTEGYFLQKAKLPLKLLSVRCGLAKYGKNNITYVEGMGSFHRLEAFYTDFPCLRDNWQEIERLKECTKCKACMNACPTGAISSDRFLLHAEKCLTFLNEFPGEFPAWIDPKWHNCIVGCLFCQNACPVNKNTKFWIEENISFSNDESKLLLSETSKEKFSASTLEKLDELGLVEYLDVLPRNLGVLIRNFDPETV